MKRLILTAVVLTAAFVQPAAAWLPIGQTPGTDGLYFYNFYGDRFNAYHFQETVYTYPGGGSVSVWSVTAPELTWYFPVEVQAALGGSYSVRMNFGGTWVTGINKWVPSATLYYPNVYEPSGTERRLISLVGDYFSFTEVSPGVRSFDILLRPLVSPHVKLPDGTLKPLSDFGITSNFRLSGTLTNKPDFSPDPFLALPPGQWYEGSMVLSVQPVPEPVFFQMGALMGLSGLGLLRLRRRA